MNRPQRSFDRRAGQGAPSEVAALDNISRQLVYFWITAEKLNSRQAREAALKRMAKSERLNFA